MGGGGSVWDAMSYDPDADLFYVGTGNAGPWSAEARKQGKDKDNLYTASIVAVRPETGKLAWYFQMVPGDHWDYDSVQHLMLADIDIKGQRRKVIMQANKDGFYYVIDRVTGKFISGQPFAMVTWASGLNEETGRPIVNPQAYYGTEAVPVTPGTGGAHNWAPMSFNPSHGLVYIPTTVAGSRLYATNPNFQYKEGLMNTGQSLGRAANINLAGAPKGVDSKPLPAPPAIGPVPPQGSGTGALVAWDIVAQKERWRAPQGGGGGGGTVATAGNLVFQVVPDGRLMAYTADKGDKVFEVQTGLRTGMGPPITYMLDGKQYVALVGGSGGRVVANREAAEGPGGAPAPAKETPGAGNPKLLVFTLGRI
jgi:quinohemoprotein ethanol dehydrogenase